MPKGYIGMNKYASKELHIPFHHKANVIEVDETLGKRMDRRTIAHEKGEMFYMKKKHLHYEEAHRKALVFEKLTKKEQNKILKEK